MKHLILAIIIALGINTVADAAQYVIRYQNGKWQAVIASNYAPVYPYAPCPYHVAPVYPVYPHYYHEPRPCQPRYRHDHRRPRHHRGCN